MLSGTSGKFLILKSKKNRTRNETNNEIILGNERHINLASPFKKLFSTFFIDPKGILLVYLLYGYLCTVKNTEYSYWIKNCFLNQAIFTSKMTMKTSVKTAVKTTVKTVVKKTFFRIVSVEIYGKNFFSL